MQKRGFPTSGYIGLERRRWPRDPNNAALSGDPPDPPDPPALEALFFSTQDLAPEDQFAAWRAYMSPLVEVRLPDEAIIKDGFPVEHTAWNLGDMLVVQQRVPPYSYARTSAKLRVNSIDHWVVEILRSGKTWTEVNGIVAVNEPGKAEIRTLTIPFSGRTTAAESLLMYLPRHLFPQVDISHTSKNNVILSGNLSSLLLDFILGLENRLLTLAAHELPSVIQTTQSLISNCLASLPEHLPESEDRITISLMERARQYIAANLDSPTLSADILSRALGVSRTHLYHLFEASDGVLHYIQRQRLLRAHATLSDLTNNQHIFDIGERAGFSSAANFSRAFSKQFGYSPREARNATVDGYYVHLTPVGKQIVQPFETWLKELGT